VSQRGDMAWHAFGVSRIRFGVFWLLAPALVLLIGGYIDPLLRILRLSFGEDTWTFSNYTRIVSDPVIVVILLRTIRLSAEVTALCILLGYPIAYVMSRSSARIQRTMALLVVIPLWTSVLVRSYAWIVILGRNGLANKALEMFGAREAPLLLVYNRFGVYVGMVHVMLPFVVLPLFGVMRRIDGQFLAIAESLGAGAGRAFLSVFLPLSLPGVVAGSLLVFTISLGFFVTPAMLGGLAETTYVMLIEKQVDELNNWPLAAAMSVVLLVITGVLVVLYQRAAYVGRVGIRLGRFGLLILLRWPNRIGGLVGRARRARDDRRQTRHRLPFVEVTSWVVLAFLFLPLLVIVPLAFSAAPFLEFPPPAFSLRWFINYFTRADWLGPTVTSLEVASMTMIAATVIGGLAAVGLVRGRFTGKRILTAALLSPMVVPTIVLAIALYYLYARYKLVGTVGGLVLAHLVLATPYVILVLSAALQAVDEGLERAALTLGAGRVVAFLRITFPLIRPAVLVAAFFAFLTSFDDLVLALFLSGTTATTLPKRMWEGIRFEVDPTIAAVSVLLVALSALLIVSAELLRRTGASARRATAEVDLA
jgi:putative spermidine/putrescine transport system permease protein